MADDAIGDAWGARGGSLDLFRGRDPREGICVGSRVEATGGVFHVCDDESVPRVGAALHRTP